MLHVCARRFPSETFEHSPEIKRRREEKNDFGMITIVYSTTNLQDFKTSLNRVAQLATYVRA